MNKAVKRFLAKTKLGGLPLEWTSTLKEKTPCLLWTGCIHKNGYGRIYRNPDLQNVPIVMQAHRFSYETFIDLVPKGQILDHLCRVRNCVNPFHVEPVTYKQNSNRSSILKERVKAMGLKYGRINGLNNKRSNRDLPEGVFRNKNGFQVTKWNKYKKKTVYVGFYKTVLEAELAHKLFKVTEE